MVVCIFVMVGWLTHWRLFHTLIMPAWRTLRHTRMMLLQTLFGSNVIVIFFAKLVVVFVLTIASVLLPAITRYLLSSIDKVWLTFKYGKNGNFSSAQQPIDLCGIHMIWVWSFQGIIWWTHHSLRVNNYNKLQIEYFPSNTHILYSWVLFVFIFKSFKFKYQFRVILEARSSMNNGWRMWPIFVSFISTFIDWNMSVTWIILFA